MNSLGKFNTEAKLVLELIDSMSPSPLMVASSVVFSTDVSYSAYIWCICLFRYTTILSSSVLVADLAFGFDEYFS